MGSNISTELFIAIQYCKRYLCSQEECWTKKINFIVKISTSMEGQCSSIISGWATSKPKLKNIKRDFGKRQKLEV
jgi:hypothetical protein